ncbi:MAG: hypothetical protein MZV64_13575 [Ignavibacteriales bacterium]|nr:hypothetical protein [Ignavibacteriales bacterium]
MPPPADAADTGTADAAGAGLAELAPHLLLQRHQVRPPRGVRRPRLPHAARRRPAASRPDGSSRCARRRPSLPCIAPRAPRARRPRR